MRIQHSTFSAWHAKAGLFLLVGLALAGCKGSARPTGTVTGTVTYKGAPVPSGRVTFYGPDDQVASAPLDEDGSYEATDVPVGPAKVTVTTPPSTSVIEKVAKQYPNGRRFGMGKPIEAPKNIVTIPAKYSNAAQSNLSLNVQEGIQTYDIALK